MAAESQEDYEAIAHALFDARWSEVPEEEELRASWEAGFDEAIRAVACGLASNDPRFDRKWFIKLALTEGEE